MKTLTKERVSLSGLSNESGVLSMDLIGDGLNEVICNKLIEFQAKSIEDHEKQLALQKVEKEKHYKRVYIEAFINYLCGFYRINRAQAVNLLKGLNKEEVEKLDEWIISKIKPRAKFQLFMSLLGLSSCLALDVTFGLFYGVGFVFVFNWLVGGFSLISLLSTTIMPGDMGPAGFLNIGTRYVKICGENYFPHDILQEKLKLPEVNN